MAQILVVEDESSLRATIAYNLKKAGHEVRTVADGEAALAQARAQPPDLIILDVMLPTIDGFDVCRHIRRSSAVPILMLTARDDEVDRVVGLEIGADDYMTKPFSMRELLARVKALLRRRDLLEQELETSQARSDEVFEIEDLRIEPHAYRVTRRGEEIALTPKEMDLLVYLARHRGHVCPTRRILDEVWGYDYYGDSRTVAVHVHSLREKLEEDPRRPRLIETVRGVGYRLGR
ncbi:MAG: response regulator transcription factor [Sphaerobacter sp.]|nr:response regulator transcription factor [Sphaerobacter sp.]